ncbi:hypothetical protein MtrunA17_Chr6g0460741 [Medicago truncatula]|uniref:Transmembrane protein, putative n=1 Tax=Medicago truncatula TaxID=3880 RepID=A0A072U791_MEDTR|nr:transmembrane protein, putative [Medicago truncatula]RHN50737.1 hypothetical protein MtrunA17_Chr6g0460741 [Medicago truncatula]
MKATIKIVFIILVLSYVYVAAVPSTRSRMTKTMDIDLEAKEDLIMSLMNNDQLFDLKVEFEKRRMMTDLSDYPGTGPNHHHDPKSPGKA